MQVYAIYTLPFKSLGFLNVFERRLVCSQILRLFDQKYSKNSNIEKY